MGKKKILIVDDEKDIMRTVALNLETDGYEIISAYDGLSGLEKARSSIPDLIILDLMLPKIDGYLICGLLKADTKFNKIPILIFTAKAQQGDKRLAEEAGADAYVTKPFDHKILLKTIRELLKG